MGFGSGFVLGFILGSSSSSGTEATQSHISGGPITTPPVTLDSVTLNELSHQMFSIAGWFIPLAILFFAIRFFYRCLKRFMVVNESHVDSYYSHYGGSRYSASGSQGQGVSSNLKSIGSSSSYYRRSDTSSSSDSSDLLGTIVGIEVGMAVAESLESAVSDRSSDSTNSIGGWD